MTSAAVGKKDLSRETVAAHGQTKHGLFFILSTTEQITMQRESLVANKAEAMSSIFLELMADCGGGGVADAPWCLSSCSALPNCSSSPQNSALLGCFFLKFIRTLLRRATTHCPYKSGLLMRFSSYSWRIEARMCA